MTETTLHDRFLMAVQAINSVDDGTPTSSLFPEVYDMDTVLVVLHMANETWCRRAAGELCDAEVTNILANLATVLLATGYAHGAAHVASIAAAEVVVPRDLSELFAEYAPDIAGEQPDDN